MLSQIKRPDRQPRGFSLIEVLIGLVILAVGMLALAGLQVTSVRGNFFSSTLMQATYAAQDRLELLKNLSFDSAPLQPGNYGDGTVTLSGIAFDRAYRVAVNGNLKNITYTVSWKDGTNHRVSFSTIRSQ